MKRLSIENLLNSICACPTLDCYAEFKLQLIKVLAFTTATFNLFMRNVATDADDHYNTNLPTSKHPHF